MQDYRLTCVKDENRNRLPRSHENGFSELQSFQISTTNEVLRKVRFVLPTEDPFGYKMIILSPTVNQF